ncbi:TetR/AcrR family transcriptional regulator [Mycolicibacterium vaccae]|uniref:TetR family transcriptional regulator n=1 Tax=Mycolicibacterium vaccae ATCC 25954 TaxID=1194972 RepID=K0VLW8_MYCVA|nr:TetR family transcriptional regulator [Mycolicibacterium vaccae]EJZ12134.1 TetR family transcriptional regulator [Mycolicibacterium vaccae ATCC 25954]MCV7060980.1 TetR family transcriptional regulator [Mycolicibacterium vaccae]
MSAPDRSSSLRERKKTQTRLAIRHHAFRLFETKGYANTTIEQIAAAAEVSPRTFYRYFGVKEALLVSDDHSAPIAAAFAAAPRELSIAAAYRHAVEQVFGNLTAEQREDAVVGQRLLYQVPEARGLIYAEYVALIDTIADTLTERLGEESDDLERRVIAGAIVGVLIAASHNTPLPHETLLKALAILDTKLV